MFIQPVIAHWYWNRMADVLPKVLSNVFVVWNLPYFGSNSGEVSTTFCRWHFQMYFLYGNHFIFFWKVQSSLTLWVQFAKSLYYLNRYWTNVEFWDASSTISKMITAKYIFKFIVILTYATPYVCLSVRKYFKFSNTTILLLPIHTLLSCFPIHWTRHSLVENGHYKSLKSFCYFIAAVHLMNMNLVSNNGLITTSYCLVQR